MSAYRPGQLYTGADGDLLFVILPGDDAEFVTNRGTRVTVAEVERVYAPLTLVRPVGSEAGCPTSGTEISDRPGYVVGRCGHAVWARDWRVGFRSCKPCGGDWEDQGNGADFFACEHETTDDPGHDSKVCRRLTDVEIDAVMCDPAVPGPVEQHGGAQR
ncbi:MAG: hypothetical protein ACRDQ0_03200 [Pseudonocardia sp.]